MKQISLRSYKIPLLFSIQAHGGIVKKAAKAAAEKALNEAIEAKNAALAWAKASIDALAEKVNESIRNIEAQVMEAIAKPVQKVTDIMNTINDIKAGFPTCVDKVQGHINDTIAKMNDELEICRNTAFDQTKELFTECFTAINNFPVHSANYLKTTTNCVKHTETSRCTSVHKFAKATACLTHATDDFQNQIRKDIASANKTLTEAPSRALPIVTGAGNCSAKAVDEAYDSLNETLGVIKKCEFPN